MTIICQENNTVTTTIGQRIKLVRKREGLSQAEFGKALNCSQGFIGHIENGRNQPSAELLTRIAIKYNLSLDWLLANDNQPTIVYDFGVHFDPEMEQIIGILLNDPELKKSVMKLLFAKKALKDALKELGLDEDDI